APGFILTGIATKALGANQEAELDRTISATAPVRRSGLPEDVANAALFLASVEASYVTGEVFDVNGGIYFDCRRLGRRLSCDRGPAGPAAVPDRCPNRLH